MGRKTAHFKPYWAFIGTGRKRKRKESSSSTFISALNVLASFLEHIHSNIKKGEKDDERKMDKP